MEFWFLSRVHKYRYVWIGLLLLMFVVGTCSAVFAATCAPRALFTEGMATKSCERVFVGLLGNPQKPYAAELWLCHDGSWTSVRYYPTGLVCMQAIGANGQLTPLSSGPET